MNNEPNARKNLLVRGYENTRENFADFFIEVGQLLWSGFSGEFVGAYRSTRPSGSKDASVWASGRVGLNVVFGVYAAISPSGWHHYGFFLAAIDFNG